MLFCVLAACFLFHRPERVGPPIRLQPFYSPLPRRLAPAPDRWIPPKWGWLWRTKELLLGRQKVVTIEGQVLSLPADESSLVRLGIPERRADSTSENNISSWLLASNEVKSIRGALSSARNLVVSGGRIGLGEKRQGILMSWEQLTPGLASSPSAGLRFEVFPVVRGRSISASVAICFTQFATNAESITTETNLALTGQFEIPQGSAVLILNAPLERTNASR